MEHIEIIKDLVEIIKQAIESGDWKVDGACDPDLALYRAEKALVAEGYRLDGLTGTEYLKQ
jgi:hypothetical protein